MFGEPTPTPFDLRWRMFGVPVRVHPWFWIVSVALGFEWLKSGFQYLLMWVACVFVSILLHELGHVFAGRLFGSRAHIVLYMLGGLAVGSSDVSRRWQRIIVYLAGPGVQLALYGVLLALEHYGYLARLLVSVPVRAMVPIMIGYGMLLLINLWWPLFNLLPIWPLDGGRVSREIFQWVWPSQGTRASLVLSIVTAAVLALNTIAVFCKYPSLERIHPWLGYLDLGHPINALFIAMLGAASYIELQQLHGRGGPRWRRQEEEEERMPWERDPDYWKSGRTDPWD